MRVNSRWGSQNARLRSVLCRKQHSPPNERPPLGYFFQIGCAAPQKAARQQVMPDDHSESVPPLPIPNRTVKRLHADDSADSRVKVGNRQAPQQQQKPHPEKVGFLRLRPRDGFQRHCSWHDRIYRLRLNEMYCSPTATGTVPNDRNGPRKSGRSTALAPC